MPRDKKRKSRKSKSEKSLAQKSQGVSSNKMSKKKSEADVDLVSDDDVIEIIQGTEEVDFRTFSQDDDTLDASGLQSLEICEIDYDGDVLTGTGGASYMRTLTDEIKYRKLDCNSVLVAVEPPGQLYFTGKALIKVVKGVVDIHGFECRNDGKKYAIFSAKGHSSISSVTAVSSKNKLGASAADEQNEVHPNISPEELQLNAAVFIMEGFENDWCEGLRQIYPTAANFIGPTMTGMGPGKTPQLNTLMDKVGFQLIKNHKNGKYKYLELPEYWNEIYTDLVDRYGCSNGVVCPFGGKGVGKSTFVRWLTNRFLSKRHSKVLFIDLDPGQTEFTPPGMMSVHLCTEPILGPNFTHLKQVSRSIFLGGVNVADFPVLYIKSVKELYEYCLNNAEFQGIPWIINTMGFSQGLGVHFACEIVKIFHPKCVIQINISNDKRSFPFLLNHQNVTNFKSCLAKEVNYSSQLTDYAFLSVRSVCGRDDVSNINAWGVSPKVAREMVITSYFAEKIGSAEGYNLRSVVPQCLPLDDIAIGTMNSALSYGNIIRALNGNLVAFCQMSESLFLTVPNTKKKFITTAGNFKNTCLGYGIVRAVDTKSGLLYVISTIQEDEILSKVNVVLVAGDVGLPVHFYIHSSNSKTVIPYVINRNEGTSTLHTATKKFYVPKRQTHNVLKNSLM